MWMGDELSIHFICFLKHQLLYYVKNSLFYKKYAVERKTCLQTYVVILHSKLL